jgi:hypothetical protein
MSSWVARWWHCSDQALHRQRNSGGTSSIRVSSHLPPRGPDWRTRLWQRTSTLGGRLVAVVETKVKASTAAAAVSGLALWALGRYVFKGSVPDVVASWVYVLVPGLLAWGAGYLAPHTPRALPVVAMPPAQEPPAIPPAARGMFVDPAQVPTELKEPATQPGQPPDQKTLTPPPGAGM